MKLTIAEVDIEECICTARCVTGCEDNKDKDMKQTLDEFVCSAKCVTI